MAAPSDNQHPKRLPGASVTIGTAPLEYEHQSRTRVDAETTRGLPIQLPAPIDDDDLLFEGSLRIRQTFVWPLGVFLVAVFIGTWIPFNIMLLASILLGLYIGVHYTPYGEHESFATRIFVALSLPLLVAIGARLSARFWAYPIVLTFLLACLTVYLHTQHGRAPFAFFRDYRYALLPSVRAPRLKANLNVLLLGAVLALLVLIPRYSHALALFSIGLVSVLFALNGDANLFSRLGQGLRVLSLYVSYGNRRLPAGVWLPEEDFGSRLIRTALLLGSFSLTAAVPILHHFPWSSLILAAKHSITGIFDTHISSVHAFSTAFTYTVQLILVPFLATLALFCVYAPLIRESQRIDEDVDTRQDKLDNTDERTEVQRIAETLATSTAETTDPRGNRLRFSEQLYLGRVIHDENRPVIVPRDVLNYHCYIMGASGSFKTTRGIMGLLNQVLSPYRLDDGTGEPLWSEPHPVMVIDYKGDDALFYFAKEQAERHGRKFRFFTPEYTDPDSLYPKDSFYWNPLADLKSEFRNSLFIAELLLDGLSLHHGQEYGPRYFTMRNLTALIRALERDQERPRRRHGKGRFRGRGGDRSGGSMPTSWTELADVIDDLPPQWREEASQLLGSLEELERIPQLGNLEGEPHPEEIRMSQFLEDNEVLYFYFPEFSGGTFTLPQIGKLALYGVLSAAQDRRRRGLKQRQTYIFIDELQIIASRALELILAQARGFGFGLIMANQELSQLKGRDYDLTDLVMMSMMKLYFQVDTPRTAENLISLSGIELAEMESYSEGTKVGQKTTLVGKKTTVIRPVAVETATTTWQDTTKPKLTINDINEASANEDLFVFQMRPNRGLHDANGVPLVLQTDHTITRSKYEAYSNKKSADWPRVPTVVPLEAGPPILEPGQNSEAHPIETKAPPVETDSTVTPEKPSQTTKETKAKSEVADPIDQGTLTQLDTLFESISGTRVEKPNENRT